MNSELGQDREQKWITIEKHETQRLIKIVTSESIEDMMKAETIESFKY